MAETKLLPHYPLCEVCGALGWNYVRDVAEVDSDHQYYRKFEPYGPIHYYCDEHVRQPERVSLLTLFPRRLAMPQDDVDPDEDVDDE